VDTKINLRLGISWLWGDYNFLKTVSAPWSEMCYDGHGTDLKIPSLRRTHFCFARVNDSDTAVMTPHYHDAHTIATPWAGLPCGHVGITDGLCQTILLISNWLRLYIINYPNLRYATRSGRSLTNFCLGYDVLWNAGIYDMLHIELNGRIACDDGLGKICNETTAVCFKTLHRN
jgi:hypothetical protein